MHVCVNLAYFLCFHFGIPNLYLWLVEPMYRFEGLDECIQVAFEVLHLEFKQRSALGNRYLFVLLAVLLGLHCRGTANTREQKARDGFP